MKHAAPRRLGGRHWLLPSVLVVALAVLVGLGRISRSIVADLASWWPVWLIFGVGFAVGRRRRLGRIKVAGLLSLLLSFSLVVFAYGHLAGWPFLPSAVADLEGPAAPSLERAAISATLEGGSIDVAAGETGALYVVGILRGGGDVGVPSANEQQQGGDISIRVVPDQSPGLYKYAGWAILLNPSPTWTLNLGGEIDADLSELTVANLQLGGSGSVRVGGTTGSTPITIDGDFVLSIPDDQAVRVIGPAQTPSSWVRTDVGANSPTDGTGWVVSIAEGAVVEIVTR